jgi:hypothetical protein
MGPPATIVAAAILGALYGLVLGGVGGWLLVEYVSGTGQVGAEHLSGLGAKGLVEIVVQFLAGMVVLATGAIRLVVRRAGRMVVVPLVLVLGIGAVGEVIDVSTGESAVSNLIGLGVLALAAVPVALLLSPSGRRWQRPWRSRSAALRLTDQRVISTVHAHRADRKRNR